MIVEDDYSFDVMLLAVTVGIPWKFLGSLDSIAVRSDFKELRIKLVGFPPYGEIQTQQYLGYDLIDPTESKLAPYSGTYLYYFLGVMTEDDVRKIVSKNLTLSYTYVDRFQKYLKHESYSRLYRGHSFRHILDLYITDRELFYELLGESDDLILNNITIETYEF